MAAEQPGKHSPEDDTALLIVALNHVMAWHEARIDRGVQVINYFVVAGAVLITAYAGALNGKHYGIAVVVALSGMALAIFAFITVRQQRRGAETPSPRLVSSRKGLLVSSMSPLSAYMSQRQEANERVLKT